MGPDVTVAVPAYNAASTLPDLLLALEGQRTRRTFEVVVVDDGSGDETPELLERWAADHPALLLKCVRQENGGPAAARNRAAAQGTGAVLLFTDSDCVPRPDWVETLCDCLAARPEAGAAGGSYDIANPASRLARLIHAEILWRHATMGPWIRFAGSYNLAVRREAFEVLGGFSTRYRSASAEDNDFSYRLLHSGRKIAFCGAAKVAHFHTDRLPRYLREQYRHGLWRAVLYREHPAMAGGDDYTRWKDVVEVPLALATGTALVVGLVWAPAFGAGAAGLAALAAMQVSQGLEIARRGPPGLPAEPLGFAVVGTLRAFARGAGFVAGAARAVKGALPGARAL